MSYITKFWKIIITFIVTFITVVVSSDNTNFVYNILNQIGVTEPALQKSILSAVIVTVIGIVQLLLEVLYKLLLYCIKKYFERLTVYIDFKVKNKSKELIKFKPVAKVYEEVQVDIELNIDPAGKISMFILKLLGLQIELFFNPQIIEVSLVNDQEWCNEKARTKLNEEQVICISVLENYRLGGHTKNSFTITESIIVFPKRLSREIAHIDFKLTSKRWSSISRTLCDSNMKDLCIECEGGK